jgi:ATP-dependent 26S proteasome regulatory subunit
MSVYDEFCGKMDIDCNILRARPLQQIVLNAIKKQFKEKSFLTTFISGPPGIGKTKIANLLAQEYNGVLFKTTIDSCINRFARFYRDVSPSINKPFIVLMDEIDESTTAIIGKIDTNMARDDEKKLNKRSWNEFFDNINDGIYPYTIFILISNTSKSDIDSKDNSLLRAGRVNIHITMTENNSSITYMN